MGVNKTSNQQLLTSLVDLLGNNLNVLSKMNEQEIANTIHSYVYKWNYVLYSFHKHIECIYSILYSVYIMRRVI